MAPSHSAPGTFYTLWQLPEYYLLLAPDLTILDATDRFLAVTMKEREAIVGRGVFDVFPRDEQNAWKVFVDSVDHVRDTGTSHEMTRIRYDLPRPAEQGGGLEERYWETTNYPQLDAQGNVQAILIKTRDVTAQHFAEKNAQTMEHNLREIQERSDFIIESLPVMAWTTRADGSADYFNQRWLTFTGRELAQELESGWLESVHPDDRAATGAAWQRAYESGESYQTEYRLRCADGDYRWVLARGIPRRDAQGRVTMWVGCSADIHDQKALVAELLQANEEQAALSDQAYQAHQLAVSQRESFYALFMQAPAFIGMLRGPEHRYEFVNPPYYELFPGRELLGRTIAEAVPEVVEQGFGALFDQVYQTGEPWVGNEVLFQVQRRDTGLVEDAYFNATLQALRENGAIVGVSSFAFEVTELVRARQKLEQLLNDTTTS
ncbi:PAS domain-containing protein [Hymenobacter sp. B1770]|uniref:PAS domain-containing protein n=1 Tax=Hymenobacter sp. B1770 TaxID=1718788 RepID=UPI003CEC3E0D